MRVSAAHRRHWQERLIREREACARRLAQALPAADRCAAALKHRWPAIEGVWLFGSAVEGTFGMDSDLDLAVEGLPNPDLLDAMAEAQGAAYGETDLGVDLVRLESLPPHWQRRIRDRGRRLL
jgi:predicted nucleotidyltransferase